MCRINLCFFAQVTLLAILNCAQASFDHFERNCDVWSLVRTHCRDLLGAEDLERYKQLFENTYDEDLQSDWEDLLEKFYPEDEFIDAGRYDFDDDSEEQAELTRKRLIALHQLKAFSLYIEDKPALSAAYHEFLVSKFAMVLACIIIVVTIISHHRCSVGALQSRGYRRKGAWAANGVYGTGEI